MYVGIDIIEIKRIERLFSANEGFLKKIYTENEVAYCNGRKNKYQHFAARFAAKEAMFKALGTGWAGTMKWTDIETLNDETGRPYLNLYGSVKELADKKNINSIAVSLSHCQDYAIAEVHAEAVAELVDERIATKQDLKELEIILKQDVKQLELRLTIRLGAMMAASIAIIAALVKLL